MEKRVLETMKALATKAENPDYQEGLYCSSAYLHSTERASLSHIYGTLLNLNIALSVNHKSFEALWIGMPRIRILAQKSYPFK
jgi:hypothetical protein